MTNDGAPAITKYEATTLVGVRMEQLALGAPSTLPAEVLENMKDVRAIAREELRRKCIPLLVTRTMNDNTTRTWRANDMYQSPE